MHMRKEVSLLLLAIIGYAFAQSNITDDVTTMMVDIPSTVASEPDESTFINSGDSTITTEASQTFPGSGASQTSTFLGSGASQTSTFLGSGASQTSTFPGSGASQTSTFPGSGASQTSTFPGSGASQTSTFLGSGASQTSTFPGSGANQTSTFLGSGASQTSTFSVSSTSTSRVDNSTVVPAVSSSTFISTSLSMLPVLTPSPTTSSLEAVMTTATTSIVSQPIASTTALPSFSLISTPSFSVSTAEITADLQSSTPSIDTPLSSSDIIFTPSSTAVSTSQVITSDSTIINVSTFFSTVISDTPLSSSDIIVTPSFASTAVSTSQVIISDSTIIDVSTFFSTVTSSIVETITVETIISTTPLVSSIVTTSGSVTTTFFTSSSAEISTMTSSSSIPQVTPTPLPPNDTALPFLTFSNQKQQLRRYLDGVSDVIYIPIGFPFGLQTHTSAYVGTNGVISFSRPFYYWYPSPFPGHFYLRRFHVVAPYWADHDIRTNGSVCYETFERGRSQNDDLMLDKVNTFLQSNMASNFSGTFMILAEWNGVHPYPHGSTYLFYFQMYYPSITQFINQENTYQALVITDGRESYTVFTYKCDLIQWSGLYSYPTIGYNAGGTLFANHPLTGREEANQIDCTNDNSQYVNVVYKISADPGVIEQLRSQCLSWYFSDIESYGSSENISAFSRRQIPCPCTSRQAWWDRRFWYFTRKDNSFCFIERFRNVLGGAQECCYSSSPQMFGALVLQGRSSGGLLRYHPYWSYTVNYPNYIEYDRNAQELCCLSAVGYCNLYHERRPPNNCEGYIPQRRTWGWGDPHITTTDGRRYTFNGLGEYVLLRTNISDFEFQGRTMPADNSNATIFSAFALRDHGDVIEVCFINKTEPLLISLNGTDISEMLSSVGDNVTVSSTFIELSSNNSIAVSFSSGMGITINSTAGLLVYTLEVPLSFEGTTSGLLGNYNNDNSDEFIFRNGTTISNSSSDKEIHQFGQSWQITQAESIFTYEASESVVTFSNPNHTPPFLDEIVTNLMGNSTLTNVCGNNVECLFDFDQTGDVEVGMAAMAVENETATEVQEAFSFPPNITAPETFMATVGEESVYTFTASSDSENINVIILHEGEETLPSGVQMNNLNGSNYTITWTPADNTSVLNLTIVAVDPENISSIFDPVVQLCACENGGSCTTDGLLASDFSFIILNCECPEGYDGEFCQNDADGCEIISCLEGQQCFDYPAPQVGAECACPDGYATGNDSKCVDINECVNRSTNDCTQQCINTPGSFECDCYDGYRAITANATQCEDINECEEYNDCHQICTNTEGSYYCSCNTGFVLTADNRTCGAEAPCTMTNCSQLCANISEREICFCMPGYQLDADNITCSDTDECTENPCDQNCANTVGSFICSCNNGYELDENGRSCNDIDECLSGPCPSDLICNNTDGGYSCDCPDGTVRNGTDCILEAVVVSRVFVTSTSAVLPTTSLTATPSVSTTPGGRGSDDGLSDAAIVGIVFGVMIGAAFLAIVVIIIICRITARNKTSFAIKPLDSKPVNDSLIKANPNIPMDVISVGAESNP